VFGGVAEAAPPRRHPGRRRGAGRGAERRALGQRGRLESQSQPDQAQLDHVHRLRGGQPAVVVPRVGGARGAAGGALGRQAAATVGGAHFHVVKHQPVIYFVNYKVLYMPQNFFCVC